MKILHFPELRQVYSFDCGACATACLLTYYGIEVREDSIMRLAETTEGGTHPKGIGKVLSYYGLEFDMMSMSIGDLKKSINKKHPVLIAVQAYKTTSEPYSNCWDDGHYVVAIGYDDNNIYFEDPSSYKRTWLSFVELEERWHDIVNNEKLHQWGCVVKGKPKYKKNDTTHMD